jgi:2'-5' RNA ligase
VRLFVAVDVGDQVRRAAAGVIDELERRTARLAPRARVSFVRPDRLHLTIRFVGEVDDDLGRRIRAALEPPLDTSPFDLTVAGIGRFPPGSRPRVVWAGVTRGEDRLRAVEREVRFRLDPLTDASDAEPFRPHLTLARIRRPAGLRAAALLEGLENATLGPCHVGAVTLCESRLSSAEPTYVALGRTPLGRA